MSGGGDLARHVLDAAPIALIAVDAAGRLQYANPAFWADAGVPPDACPPGRPVGDLLRLLADRGFHGPGDPAAQVAALLALDRTRPVRCQLRSATGQVRDIFAFPVPGGGWTALSHPLTEAEAARQDRLALLEETLGRLSAGVAVFDADLRVRLANPAYARLVGAPAPPKPGTTHLDLLDGLEAAGEFASDRLTPAAIAALMAMARHKPIHQMRQRPNGHVTGLHGQPIAEGGLLIEVSDITALRRAEEAAGASDQRALLEASLAAIQHGIAVFGPDRRLRVFNARLAELTGADPAEQTVGLSLEEIFDRQVARGRITAENAAWSVAVDRSVRQRYLRPGGGGRTLEVTSDPLPDGGFALIIADITDRVAAETAARERAAVLEASFAAMRHGFNLYGPDHRLIAVNVNTSALAGFPEDRPRPGMHLTDVIAAQLRRGILTEAEAAQVLALDRSRPHRYSRHRPDGMVIEIRSDPTPDGGFVVTFTDITELAAARQEAQDRAAMLEAALSSIRHGIVMFGPDRRLRATNIRTPNLTGLPADRLLPGRLMDEMIDEQVARGNISPEGAVAMKGYDRSRPLSYQRRRRDGQELEAISDPMPDGGYVITYTDVTEDRRIRAELERARAAAEAASQAKSRFLATMTHELRSPLSAMIGFSEAILAARDPTRIAEFAGAVRDAGRHLLMLVDDILDVARSQTGALALDRHAIELPPVLEGALLAIQPQAAEAGLTLGSDLAPGLPQLIGDARRLRQILLNLLGNAVKFTPAGGRITLSAAIDAAGLVIDVADTGIGIPAEHRERVFEPFSQVDSALARRFQGSGLGLHLARSMAEAMGGALGLVAQDAPGTRVRLAFPRACLTSSPAAPTSAAALKDPPP
jgi:signal transduction histidine kinase